MRVEGRLQRLQLCRVVVADDECVQRRRGEFAREEHE